MRHAAVWSGNIRIDDKAEQQMRESVSLHLPLTVTVSENRLESGRFVIRAVRLVLSQPRELFPVPPVHGPASSASTNRRIASSKTSRGKSLWLMTVDAATACDLAIGIATAQ